MNIAAALPGVAIPGGAPPLQPQLFNDNYQVQNLSSRKGKIYGKKKEDPRDQYQSDPQEKKKIERNAKRCRLSVSEYLRKLAMKIEPKALPPKEIEDSLMRLSEVADEIRAAGSRSNDPGFRDFCNSYSEKVYRILVETLQLMMHFRPGSEDEADGDY